MKLLRTVNHNLYLTSVVLSMIYCISCNNKNDNTFVSRDEYLGICFTMMILIGVRNVSVRKC